MDAHAFSPLLTIPGLLASPSSVWRHQKLTDRRLAFVWKRLAGLQELGVTMPMVVKEFVKQRIAPLQCHARPMWDFTNAEDPMRLQKSSLAADTLSVVLKHLTGEPEPADLPRGGCLLYLCSNKAAFAAQMPLFDEWGLLPEGIEGPRENPVFVAPLLIDPAACAPSVEAGGARLHQLLRAPTEARLC